MGEQRIYHVTHMRNLPAVLASGSLLADLNDQRQDRPEVDISSSETRDARRKALISEADQTTVAHFVPFFLSPNATLWQSIRFGETDPRLSAHALGSDIADYVVLVSTVKKVLDVAAANGATAIPFVVSDGDAAGATSRFGTTRDDAERLLRRLRSSQDLEFSPILQAELLVGGSFPLDSVTLIGVAHDKARAALKQILDGSGFTPKVAVYPPWFAKVEPVSS